MMLSKLSNPLRETSLTL